MPKLPKEKRKGLNVSSKMSKPKHVESSSEEDPSNAPEDYKKQREKNNEAVKKSRDRSRKQKQMSKRRVEDLESSNRELQGTISGLKQELSQLKDIFMAATTGQGENLSKDQLKKLLADKEEHEEVEEDESKYELVNGGAEAGSSNSEVDS